MEILPVLGALKTNCISHILTQSLEGGTSSHRADDFKHSLGASAQITIQCDHVLQKLRFICVYINLPAV